MSEYLHTLESKTTKSFLNQFLIILDFSIKIIMTFLFCFFGLVALIFTFYFFFRIVIGPVPPEIYQPLLGIAWGIPLLLYFSFLHQWIKNAKENK